MLHHRRISAPAAELQRWLGAGLDPVTLVRFQNQVQPWDALLEPISGTHGEGQTSFFCVVTLVFFCEFIWCANRINRLGERPAAQDDRRIEGLSTRLQLAGVGGSVVLWIWAMGNP
jgi:hypothetical protein